MMRPAWFSFGAVTVVLAVMGGMQWRRQQELRLAIEVAQEQSRMQARLLAENRRLLAIQPSDQELAQLRDDRAALIRLRSQVEKSNVQADFLELAMKPGGPDVTLVPADAWKNVGRASPAAALETLFWASAHTETATIASGLSLDSATQARASELWQQLPATTRENYGSAANMIATLLAQDGEQVAFIGAISETQADPDTMIIKARVENKEHQGKTENFEFRRADEGWSLAIPERALMRYQAQLNKRAGAKGSNDPK